MTKQTKSSLEGFKKQLYIKLDLRNGLNVFALTILMKEKETVDMCKIHIAAIVMSNSLRIIVFFLLI